MREWVVQVWGTQIDKERPKITLVEVVKKNVKVTENTILDQIGWPKRINVTNLDQIGYSHSSYTLKELENHFWEFYISH